MFTNKIEIKRLEGTIRDVRNSENKLRYPDIYVERITIKKITYGITIKLRNKDILETEVTPQLHKSTLIQEPLDLNFLKYPVFSIGSLCVCSDEILTVHEHIEQVKDVSFIKITANNSIKVIQTEED